MTTGDCWNDVLFVIKLVLFANLKIMYLLRKFKENIPIVMK